MKKFIISMIVASVFLLGCLPLAAGFDVEVAYVSSYVWRGMDLYPKGTPALQPSITYTAGKSGFSVNLFASYVLSERDKHKDLEELTFTFNYDFALSENISLSVGMTNYGYYYIPNYTFKDGNTQEFYAVLGFPNIFLGPALSVFYDINLGDGVYISLAGAHTFNFSKTLALTLDFSIGYNGEQWIEESGISDVNVSASIPFKLGKITIIPAFYYTHVFLESLYREGDKKDKAWFGVTMAIE